MRSEQIIYYLQVQSANFVSQFSVPVAIVAQLLQMYCVFFTNEQTNKHPQKTSYFCQHHYILGLRAQV